MLLVMELMTSVLSVLRAMIMMQVEISVLSHKTIAQSMVWMVFARNAKVLLTP